MRETGSSRVCDRANALEQYKKQIRPYEGNRVVGLAPPLKFAGAKKRDA